MKMNNTSYMTKTALSQTVWTDVCTNGQMGTHSHSCH